MLMARQLIRCLALAGLLTTGVAANAADATRTAITVKSIHCSGCARKIETALQQVSGVKLAKANVATKVVLVTVQQQQTPSPRVMWEAVEQAGYTPVKLQCPAGVFKAKPNS